MAPPSAINLRGWLIVILGFVALGITFSARATLGIAMPVWEGEFGWSRSFISGGASIALLTMAVMAPITGYVVDRWGAAPLLGGGLLLTGIAMLMTSMVQTQEQFLAIYAILGAVGFGLVSMNAVATAAAQQFPDRVGLASGIASSGSTGGQLVFVPIIASIIGLEGWRQGYWTLGLMCLALAPVVWLLLGRRRGKSALASTANANANPSAKLTANPNANAAPEQRPALGAEIRDMFSHPAYLVLLATFIICGITTGGVIETHLMPYAQACGFGPVPSATAYGVLSFFNLLGMIGAGWLADRVHRGRLLATIYALRAVAFVVLIFIGSDYTLLMIFAVMFGIFDYSTVPVTASLVAANLGLRRMGLAMGLLIAGHGVGAASGAYLGGALYDHFAAYQAVWIGSVLVAALAALMALSLAEPRREAL